MSQRIYRSAHQRTPDQIASSNSGHAMRKCLAIICACCLLSIGFGISAAKAETNVLFIFDASGSMKKPVGGTARIDLARKSLVESVLSMPNHVRVGLMVYGARRAKDCTDIHLVSPVQANARDQVVLAMAGLQAKGETPIADSIIMAARTFSSLAGQDNSIVVLTDGIEECNGDPCAAAAAVSRMGINLKINIIGFTLGAEERAAIECVTRLTGGKYYDAADARGLVNAMANVRQQVVAPPSPPPPAPVAVAPPPTAQPVIIDKSQERYRFRAVALLAPGKPYGSLTGVNWSITRVTDDKRENVVSTSTLSNNVSSELASGKYVVEAKVGLASGESPADVVSDKEMTVDVVLNAGVVEIQTFAADGVEVPREASPRVRLDIDGAEGANTGTYGASYAVAVPAGHWTVKAQLGNANVSVPVDVEAGAVVKLPVVLAAGRLVLRGRSPQQSDPLQGVRWRVVSAKDGADIFGETYFTEAVFNLAAGDYSVTATRGQATMTGTVTIHAGEVIEKDFAFPAQ